MACEGPAVMQCHHYLDICSVQITEQDLIVQVIAMEIMYMDYVGLDMPDKLNKFFCCAFLP